MVVGCDSYKVTIYIAMKKEKRRIYYSKIITELLLLSDFFMKKEGFRVILEK